MIRATFSPAIGFSLAIFMLVSACGGNGEQAEVPESFTPTATEAEYGEALAEIVGTLDTRYGELTHQLVEERLRGAQRDVEVAAELLAAAAPGLAEADLAAADEIEELEAPDRFAAEQDAFVAGLHDIADHNERLAAAASAGDVEVVEQLFAELGQRVEELQGDLSPQFIGFIVFQGAAPGGYLSRFDPWYVGLQILM